MNTVIPARECGSESALLVSELKEGEREKGRERERGRGRGRERGRERERGR